MLPLPCSGPPLACRALTAAPVMGLLLPCNVTVAAVEDNVTEVALVDPMSMLGVVDNPDLKSIADEAHARLGRVAAALRQTIELRKE